MPGKGKGKGTGSIGALGLALSLAALILIEPATSRAQCADLIQEQQPVKIRIDVEGGPVKATLENTQAAGDFIALLPLTLSLTDYAATEKISDLPSRLSVEGAPDGISPVTGEITYYAPWGNLAIFLKGFRYSSGLVRLGKVDSGLDALRRPGPLNVTISQVCD